LPIFPKAFLFFFVRF